jgi:hypothetical protein
MTPLRILGIKKEALMWNEVLKRIDSTQTPKNGVTRWGGTADSIRLVNEGINLVYRFEQNGQGDYLRLTHAKLRSEDELQAAIAYQRHLFEHGVPICEPILSLNCFGVLTQKYRKELANLISKVRKGLFAIAALKTIFSDLIWPLLVLFHQNTLLETDQIYSDT